MLAVLSAAAPGPAGVTPKGAGRTGPAGRASTGRPPRTEGGAAMTETPRPERPIRLALIIASHRRNGNAELLAETAVAAAPVPLEVDRIRLIDYRIERYPDVRHSGSPVPRIDDDYDAVLRRVLDADALLLAVPVYWYSMPGVLKDFLDRWSGSLRDPEVRFRERMRGKPVFVATVVSDEDRSVAEPLIKSLWLTCHYYLGMRWGGVAVGYGDRPGDVVNDAQGMAEARDLLKPLASEDIRKGPPGRGAAR
ncbi:MAG: NAD(P)H-dependent oxidoreductase [Bacillota bacterium]|nr:MAG: NAD(P)H-dependent oxidoreductase [Bacillota bacterium]